MEQGTIGSTVTDGDLVLLLWILDICDIEHGNLHALVPSEIPLLGFYSFFSKADDMILIIRMEVVAVSRYLQFAENVWIAWIARINHEEWVNFLERYHVRPVPHEADRVDAFARSDLLHGSGLIHIHV